MSKNIFGKNIYVRAKISWVESSHGLLQRADVHNLEEHWLQAKL